MPKDATKNVDRYKIRGGQINEFEFHENQEALAEQKQTSRTNLIPGTPPEQKMEGLQPTVKKAAPRRSTKKAPKITKTTKATKSRKSTKKVKASSSRGASAKKLAARKAAKKK